MQRYPNEFRDEAQLLSVEAVLNRLGRLDGITGGFRDPQQGVVEAFLLWLVTRPRWREGKPLRFAELRTGVDESTAGKLYDLLAAMLNSAEAIDDWIRANAS